MAEHRLRDLLAGAWIPVVGLMLLFVLQEIHVIIVRHEVSGDAAGSYAVAAVAAKAIIWVAVGLGLYLLPEAARRSHRQVDARSVLLRTVFLIAPYRPDARDLFVAGEPLLRLVFGPGLVAAAARASMARSGDDTPRMRVPLGPVPARTRSVELRLGRSASLQLPKCFCLPRSGARLLEIALALAALQLACAAAMLTLSFGHESKRRPRSTVA